MSAAVLLWVGLALHPCVMADSNAAHECPHCPPPEARQDRPCDAVLAASCDALSVANVDVRSVPTEPNDPLAVADWLVHDARPSPPSWFPRPQIARDGADPPLYVLHCVYLN